MRKEKLLPGIRLARKIARAMLQIGATVYKSLLEEPYKWACGMYMRIYNDNRMLLADYQHRMLVAKGFIKTIIEKGVNPNFIIGTMTSGIAPATSVAQLLKKELLINYESSYFVYPQKLWDQKTLEQIRGSAEIIITNSPLAIPYGIQYANELSMPFAYMRKKKKDHGKEKLLEGIVEDGTRFVFISTYEDKFEDVKESIKILQEDYGLKFSTSFHAGRQHEKVLPGEFAGLEAIVIEDLFSTGGSSAWEVYLARESGIICNYCFSIFSYGFDCLKRQFSGNGNIGDKGIKLSKPCEIDSLLSFQTLLEVIGEMQFYPPETISEMREEIEGFDERYKLFLSEKAKI